MSQLRFSRSNRAVGSFLSAFGEVRETRLTAALGYLVSRFPDAFGQILGFKPSPADEVTVEETDGGDRYDVLIRKSGEIHVIEGKLGPSQRLDQLLRYVQRVRRRTGQPPALTVVDDGSEHRHARQRAFDPIRRQVKDLRFTTWTEVAEACREITRQRRHHRSDPIGAVIAGDFATHLQENNMTNEAQPEVYLRDVSDIHSVRLYFKHRIYRCQSKFFKSAHRNLYFAPYFTRRMAEAISGENLVPVGEGISFVSRVERVQVLERRDVLAFLREIRHEDPTETASVINRGSRGKDLLLMSLGEPRHMFVSPVTKAKLAATTTFGKGAMGSRSITFDELFAAALQ